MFSCGLFPNISIKCFGQGCMYNVMTKMAELQFEAPLASFETEEWNDFNDFQTAMKTDLNKNKDNTSDETEKFTSIDNFGVGETYSGSLQDLVKSLDEKITNCFCNYDDRDVEKIAPVQIRSKDELITDHCSTWWTITGQFGNILPIDWSQSYARKLQEKALNLGERKEPEAQNLDLSDDEELANAMDYHSMIISSHHHEDSDHIVTADEVISELEIMMEDSGTDRSESEELDCPVMPTSPYSKLKEAFLTQLPKYPVEELKSMSNTELNELLSDYELTIKELSETLVQELALRDELEYDKELKNQFISLLLNIQKKRREANVDRKRRKNKTHFNNVAQTGPGNNNNSPIVEYGPNVFLSTVIPYHHLQGAPSSEQLQIYIKILQAINEESPAVPSLLTDYILKVLCPT